MNRKLDSDLTVLRKIVNREIQKSVKASSGSNVQFSTNYSYTTGGGGFGNGNTGLGGGPINITAQVYGAAGAAVDAITSVTRSTIKADGMVYLYDDEANGAFKIEAELIMDPSFWVFGGLL